MIGMLAFRPIWMFLLFCASRYRSEVLMSRLLASLCVIVACTLPCFGQAEHRLLVRVVDVGAGLCCVLVTPDHHFMIFDAGNYEDHGVTAMQAIEELIPFGSTIDLMVISH